MNARMPEHELVIKEEVQRLLLNGDVPARIAVTVHEGSSLYGLTPATVVAMACGTVGLNPDDDGVRLMTVGQTPGVTVYVCDVRHDGYDWETAHEPVHLPVVHIDYHDESTYVAMAANGEAEHVAHHVAAQHDCHGWDAVAPYFEDFTLDEAPRYRNARSQNAVNPDGTRKRVVLGPAPVAGPAPAAAAAAAAAPGPITPPPE